MTDIVVNTTNASANSVYTDTTTEVASPGVMLESAPGVPIGTPGNPLNVTGGGGGGGSDPAVANAAAPTWTEAADVLLSVDLAGNLRVIQRGNSAAPAVQTPTTSSSPAYSAGDVLGGLLTFTNFARISGLAAYLQNLTVVSAGGQTAPMYLFFFNANPSASTFTDNAAISVNSADIGKIVGYAVVNTWLSAGTATVGFVSNLAQNITLASGTSLYAVAVTQGQPTLASTSDLTFRINGPQD